MTTILEPRYMITNLIPNKPLLKIGDISTKVCGDEFTFDNGDGTTSSFTLSEIQRCHQTFRKMGWDEKRTPEEFPTHIKVGNNTHLHANK